ncbi:GNAT family N-acetyltransferase [Longispora sp. NPDC051575]|uniref:GNAT family N-acetyltransferase n=1 Tax=Longispora sp. NPDC051575 TaxID=3154943 RepID=UPI0034134F7D
MSTPELARSLAFLRAFARSQAERVVDLPYGFGAFDDTFAHSYAHNKLHLEGPAGPEDVDAVFAAAGRAHRLVHVADPDLAARVGPAFVDAGYEHSATVVMRHTGAAPDRPADPTVVVDVVDVAARTEAARREWRGEKPDAPDDVIEQLAGRGAATVRGADRVLFLVARAPDGEVACRGDLYLDPATGVAQIEDLMTLPAHTGRGYARALLADGLSRAGAAGCDLVLLVAEEDDWPRELYARLGYATIGRTHSYLRMPADS